MSEPETLVNLFQQMSDLTAPECAKCLIPHHCCESLYCEMAMQIAKNEYGVTLEPTDHPTLPLMGPTGCIAAPHFRPLCTMHTCEINKFGFKSTSINGKLAVDQEWTEAYFELREKIDKIIIDEL